MSGVRASAAASIAATFPTTPSNRGGATSRRRRRHRRVAAAFTATTGTIALVSSLTRPQAPRARTIADVLSLGLAHAATGAVAAAGVMLLVLSSAVLRGQRRAWLVALGLLVLTTVGHITKGLDVEEATLALPAIAFLLGTHRSFSATTQPRAARHAARTVIVGALGAFAAGFIAIEALTRYSHDAPRVDTRSAARAALRGIDTRRDLPVTPRAAAFIHAALFGAAAATLVIAAWRALRPVIGASQLRQHAVQEPAVRGIVGQWGNGTLDYFVLRDDKQWFLHGSTVIGYAVRFGICLVSPDPIGPPQEQAACFEAFHAFADRQGWTVAVLGADAARLAIYQSYGMRSFYVGDEGIVHVDGFSLDGGARKSLRQAVNRIARHGYTVTFHDPLDLDAATRAEVTDLMSRSRRGDVERGFSMTLGRLFDPRDTGLLLALCRDPNGRACAFCQFVPSTSPAGWSLDLMRRDTGDHPNGLLDHVIVETIRHARDTGAATVGLNFATMRAVLAEEGGSGNDTLLVRAQRAVLNRLSDDMQIRSLWNFNAKYGPEWFPRYVALDGAEHALRVALAMAAAESLWELPLVGRWLEPRTAIAPR